MEWKTFHLVFCEGGYYFAVFGADLDKNQWMEFNSTWRDDGQPANQNPVNVVSDRFVFWKTSLNPDEAFRDTSITLCDLRIKIGDTAENI